MSIKRIKGYCMVAGFSIILYLTLTRINEVGAGIEALIGLLTPFIIGIVIAFLLNGPVNYFAQVIENKLTPKFTKLTGGKSRILAMGMTYLLLIIAFSLLTSYLLPQLIGSVGQLGKNIQIYLNSLNSLIADISVDSIIPEDIWEEAQVLLQNAAKSIIAFITGSVPKLLSFAMYFGGGVLNLVIGIIVSIHLLSDKDRLISQAKRLNRAFLKEDISKQIEDMCSTVNMAFKNYVSGQLLDALIVGIVSIVGLSVLQFPYAVLIGSIMGITNIIPFYGPFIGSIPSFFILLLVDPVKALWYILFALILQQIDGNIIGPKIIGESVGLPPLWVLFAVTVGGALFGIPGMVLGTPIFAVIYETLGKSTRKREALMANRK